MSAETCENFVSGGKNGPTNRRLTQNQKEEGAGRRTPPRPLALFWLELSLPVTVILMLLVG